MQEWGFSVRDVTIHVTLWHGELDNVALPVAAVYLAAKLSNNTLHMIPNAGHFTVVARHAEDVLRDLLRRADENSLIVKSSDASKSPNPFQKG